IIHRDLYPRNVIVSGDDLGSSAMRIVLIDFGEADIGRFRPNAPESYKRLLLPGVPISPLLRWDVRSSLCRGFVEHGWVDWDWQTWLLSPWEHSTASAPISAGMRAI